MTDKHRFELGLQARAVSELADAAGVEIVCRTGCIWLTLDGDPRDLILEAGDSFKTTDHVRALIYALEPACIALADCAPMRVAATRHAPPAPRAGWLRSQFSLAQPV